MSEYINVGAMTPMGRRLPTKKSLKEAVENDSVAFDQTAMLQSGRVPGIFELKELPEGVVLSVVGPDPYEKRSWYASVERTGDKVKVK
jgi:hypothetical protein